jgi:uncharacterized protein (TIGR01244 family)
MNIVKLTNSVAVSAQITPDDVAAIAAAGFKVLINNRPDGEESNQPTSDAIAVAAQSAGMEYYHMPITAMSFPGPDFDAMSDLLDDPAQPVLAFCRTGTRCANLWVAGCDEGAREQAMATAGQGGYDLGMATKFLGR